MSSTDRRRAEKQPRDRRGGVYTLSDLNRRPVPEFDSDDDAPQEYYAGGEKSGMLVQGPTKGDDVDAIFNQAKELGAVVGSVDHLLPSSSSRSFTGTGRLLNGETVSSAQQPESVVHNITFWTNGFTVNDGPLRRLDGPENASFLESIRKSECPRELEPADRRSSVHVNLIRKSRTYPEQVECPASIVFHGAGRTLGGCNATPSAAAAAAAAEAAPVSAATDAAAPSMGLVVDKALPSTSIQLRLADGTRMIAHFNYQHTVSDIRAFISASRPGSAQNYQLQLMDFPPKLLDDPRQTIEMAGLANSVILQKCT